MPATSFFVVPAPGHYGSSSKVFSSHGSLGAARKAVSDGYVVRKGALRKGARWLRAYEEIYPIAR